MDRGRGLLITVVSATILVALAAVVVNYNLYGMERLLPQLARLIVTALLAVLLLFHLNWARWIAVVLFLFFGVPTLGGSWHYMAGHGSLLPGSALLLMAAVYTGSALILLFVPSVRNYFRRSHRNP